MENSHQLTFIAERPHFLIMELDSQVLLVFSGEVAVSAGTTDKVLASGTPLLTVAGFSQLVVDRLGYEDMRPDVEVFTKGEAQFVAGS